MTLEQEIHAEQQKEYRKRMTAEQKEKVAKQQREYRKRVKADPVKNEKFLEGCAIRSLKWRQKHPEMVRNWAQKNPDKVKAYSIKKQIRAVNNRIVIRTTELLTGPEYIPYRQRVIERLQMPDNKQKFIIDSLVIGCLLYILIEREGYSPREARGMLPNVQIKRGQRKYRRFIKVWMMLRNNDKELTLK